MLWTRNEARYSCSRWLDQCIAIHVSVRLIVFVTAAVCTAQNFFWRFVHTRSTSLVDCSIVNIAKWQRLVRWVCWKAPAPWLPLVSFWLVSDRGHTSFVELFELGLDHYWYSEESVFCRPIYISDDRVFGRLYVKLRDKCEFEPNRSTIFPTIEGNRLKVYLPMFWLWYAQCQKNYNKSINFLLSRKHLI